MSKSKICNLAADCGPDPNRPGKRRYVQIGAAFHDGERLALKIDCLPLEGSGWNGWVNVFDHSKLEARGEDGVGQFD